MSRYHFCPQDLRKSPNKKCEILYNFHHKYTERSDHYSNPRAQKTMILLILHPNWFVDFNLSQCSSSQ